MARQSNQDSRRFCSVSRQEAGKRRGRVVAEKYGWEDYEDIGYRGGYYATDINEGRYDRSAEGEDNRSRLQHQKAKRASADT